MKHVAERFENFLQELEKSEAFALVKLNLNDQTSKQCS